MAVIVERLRGVSDKLKGVSSPHSIFFPPREVGERQPIQLEGEVPSEDVADLLHYIADMLEE